MGGASFLTFRGTKGTMTQTLFPSFLSPQQAREESFSSYRSETEPDNSPAGGSPRPETPAFPVTPRTPYGLSNGSSSPALPPKSPTSQR